MRGRGSGWGQGQEAAEPWDLGSGASAPLPPTQRAASLEEEADTPCSQLGGSTRAGLPEDQAE